MIGIVLLSAAQGASAGSMVAPRLQYECETAIVFNEEAGRSRYVQNIERLRHFTAMDLDERSGSAKIEDPFLYKDILPASLRVEGKYRILAVGARNAAGQEMQVDLVMKFEDDFSPAFQERITWVGWADRPARAVTRSGVCKAMIELDRKP